MAVAASNTAYGIIRDAMIDAGKLATGEEPDSEQLATYMRRLCDVINYFQTKGLKLFFNVEVTVTLIAGTSDYVLSTGATQYPTKPLRVLQGRIQTPQGETRPINPVSWEEWNRLPQFNEGAVTAYFVDKQALTTTARFWNTPDASEALNVAILLVQEQAENPFNLELNVSFPQEWRMALRWGLADDICTGQPEVIMARCADRAQFYREELENWDVEDAPTMFAPDFRGAYYNGSFR
jgi:hypothetical protein